MTKLPRTIQLAGEWKVGVAKIDYPHTWNNIREGKNSVEIYVPDQYVQEISIQAGYYEKVLDVIDALLKAGLANTTDVVVTCDDTSKRVTVRCAKGTALELRRIWRECLVTFDNTSVRAFDKKRIHPCLTRNWKSMFLCLCRYHQEPVSWRCCCSRSSYCYSKGRTGKLY